MIERIKGILNSSFSWLLLLLGALFYFWKRDQALEDQLKEQKFDDTSKETQNEQAKADSDASAANNEYGKLLSEYNAELRSGSSSVRESGAGAEEADKSS